VWYNDAVKGKGMKKCSYCAEPVEGDAKVCKYCGRLLYNKLGENSQQTLDSGLPDVSLARGNLVKQLRSQSTLRLLLLNLITFGIYTAYYVKRQTIIINNHLNQESQIPEGYVNAIIIFAWASAAVMILDLSVEVGRSFELLINFLSILWSILVLIWAFKARNRMNTLMSATKNGFYWFNGFWTFMFNALYFNYKVNRINERMLQK
jgi:hypothetical protein